MCPFAAKSKYEIVVSGKHNSENDHKALIIDRAKKLAAVDAKAGANPSTLIVFPYDQNSRLDLYEGAIEASSGLMGNMHEYEPRNELMKIQGVFFGDGIFGLERYAMMGISDYIQAVAPFSTIQLLRYKDLTLARGYEGVRGIAIREKNIRFNDKLSGPEKLGMLQDCVNNAQTKATQQKTNKQNPGNYPISIRITKEISMQDMERLKLEGVKVELIAESSTQKDTTSKAQSIVNVRRTKKAVGKKGKRKR
jgi:hypothetical protein